MSGWSWERVDRRCLVFLVAILFVGLTWADVVQGDMVQSHGEYRRDSYAVDLKEAGFLIP